MKLCECGCGLPAPVAKRTDTRAGIVKGLPKRFRSGHHTRLPLDKSAYKVDPQTGCWRWIRAINITTGYGTFKRAGRSLVAHRFFYEQLVGPIPEGLQLDHLCRNRVCVNPAHLEPVTPRENILRGIGYAALNARKTHCKHGHPFNEANTYCDKHGHRHCRRCIAGNSARRRAVLREAR